MQACQHRLTTQSVMHKKQGSRHKYIVTMRSTRETAVITGQFQYNLCQALPKIFISQKLYFFFQFCGVSQNFICMNVFLLKKCIGTYLLYTVLILSFLPPKVAKVLPKCLATPSQVPQPCMHHLVFRQLTQPPRILKSCMIKVQRGHMIYACCGFVSPCVLLLDRL